MIKPPVVTLIAAVSDDGFISLGKGVPWDLPRDRKHFRSEIANQWLLVGRTTYEEMTGLFSDVRPPLVLTRNGLFEPSPGHNVKSANAALKLARRMRIQHLIVCGGAQCYQAIMPHAQRLMITRVHTELGRGVAFPEIRSTRWELLYQEHHSADNANVHPVTFQIFANRKTYRLVGTTHAR